jgi:hypothetical protein
VLTNFDVALCAKVAEVSISPLIGGSTARNRTLVRFSKVCTFCSWQFLRHVDGTHTTHSVSPSVHQSVAQLLSLEDTYFNSPEAALAVHDRRNTVANFKSINGAATRVKLAVALFHCWRSTYHETGRMDTDCI